MIEKGTFSIVKSVPEGIHPIASGWVCKEKLGPDNEVLKRKVRLVARGYTQRQGESFDETFAPVTDITEILVVLAMAAREKWPVHQIDVKTAYLNASIHHEIYMKMPHDTPDHSLRGATVKLNKALYGLKQAGFEWYSHLRKTLESLNWLSDELFPCRFKRAVNGNDYILLVYVDDIIITGPRTEEIIMIKEEIQDKFEIEDFGEISYLLGMRVSRTNLNEGFLLDQEAMITRLLQDHQITCKRRTPCSRDIRHLKQHNNNSESTDLEVYQSKIGSLLYLSRYTRPDISYATTFLARFQQSPDTKHMEAVDRIMCYLNQTKSKKLRIEPTHKSGTPWELEVMADADYADNSNSTESTSGLAVYLSGSLVAWESKRQKSTSLSTTESEYVALSNGCRRAQVISNFVETTLGKTCLTHLRCDNISTIKSVERTTIPPKLKHINVKYHHTRDSIKSNKVVLTYVPSEDNVADIFTKGLAKPQFETLVNRLGLTEPFEVNVGVLKD